MSNNSSQASPTVKEILKTTGIFHFQDSQLLSKVLPKLTGSHDAAFVFDNKDTFIGVVSPYHLFKKRSFHGSSKLRTCASMPPKLDLQTSLSKVAQAMIDSKIHFLPVLNSKFEGIVTIRRLLMYVVDHQLLNHNGNITFSNRKLITAKPDLSVSQALALFKQQRISKLPVVDDHNSLIGFISQFDLRDSLDVSQSVGKFDRKGEKKARLDEPIVNFLVKNVATVNRLPTFSSAAARMLDEEIGSLIVIDSRNSPIGIVTKIDLLKTIASTQSLT